MINTTNITFITCSVKKLCSSLNVSMEKSRSKMYLEDIIQKYLYKIPN